MLRRLCKVLLCLLISSSPVGAITSGTPTLKLSGGTYSTWAGFWDDVGNLTGNLTLTVDASAFTENAAPAAVTELLGGYTLHVLPASFPTATDASDGARFTCNYVGIFFDCGIEGAGALTIEGIVIIEGTSEPEHVFEFSTIGTGFACILRRNIVKACGEAVQHGDNTLDDFKCYNNIFFDCSGPGLLMIQDITDSLIANNTIVDCDVGIWGGNELALYENNLVYSNTTADFQQIATFPVGNNNANSDATGEDGDWGGGGANNVNSIGDPFNALGSDDFTITTEGVVGTAGKDLSGSFTTDFFGTTRSNWSIGACEFVSPAAGGAQIIRILLKHLEPAYDSDIHHILDPDMSKAT